MKLKYTLLLLLPLLVNCKKDVSAQKTQDSPQVTDASVNSTQTQSSAQSSANLTFGGYTWIVKSGSGLGPGPNTWNAGNVWVDTNGWMHLKLSYDATSGKWFCAGVTSTNNFTYGTFQWKIQGPVSTMDKNVVAGFFHYAGPDGFNEMDIEFARWGDAAKPNVNYSVYPAAGSTTAAQHSTANWTQTDGTSSTHRYTWTAGSVIFKSMNGLYDDDTNLFYSHTFTPPTTSIPTAGMPVKMNLWCFKGLAPSNGQNVEIIIKEFKYTPAP